MRSQRGREARRGRGPSFLRVNKQRRYERRDRKAKRRRAAALQKKKPHAHKTSMGHPQNIARVKRAKVKIDN